tara:strand:- start:24499 stop:25407 length:909 start_codon:yes stop_codon:yes gene_type:complete
LDTPTSDKNLNTKEYIALLNRPSSLNEKQTVELEKILAEFPFLQSARAIYLKGLYNNDSFRYNTELKKTAAYTTDRSVLFDFITSEQFQSIEKNSFEAAEKAVEEIAVNHIEEIKAEEQKPAEPVNKLEESIKLTIKESEATQPEKASTTAETVSESPLTETEQKLEIGRPLTFSKDETHSFSEWLQLSKITPVKREESTPQPEKQEDESGLIKKLDLIDRFIESNPKIIPSKTISVAPATLNETADNSSLMTETLAKVYLEQKKYAKAIQAYEILILKYPEKSVFFADRITEIRSLQQNNN